MRIALIEDNLAVRNAMLCMLSDDFIVSDYSNPQEFLISGAVCDMVISDWDFGHVTLDFFKNSFDPKKLMILTGSGMPVSIDCLGVFSKCMDSDDLINAVRLNLCR